MGLFCTDTAFFCIFKHLFHLIEFTMTIILDKQLGLYTLCHLQALLWCLKLDERKSPSFLFFEVVGTIN